MKKKIKINFTDFWDNFDRNDNFIMDALRVHFEPVISDDPDFVFCATFGRQHLRYSCAKIFYTGENLCPDFNLVDYALGFHNIAFEDRYLKFPHYILYPKACCLAGKKHETVDENGDILIDDKTLVRAADRQFCNYVISNAISDPSRDEMIAKLESYKNVASGGRYRNNVGGPVDDKIEFEKKYKFTMCFENTSARGYTTEKIVEAFAGTTVPIYWGNPEIAKEFNPKAFINCHDFESFEEVLAFIKKIDEDDDAYLSMLKAPAIKGEAEKFLSKTYLSDFLYEVCSQEPSKAIRRNRIYQGQRYEKQAAFHEKIDRLLYIPLRAIYYLHNKIKQK